MNNKILLSAFALALAVLVVLLLPTFSHFERIQNMFEQTIVYETSYTKEQVKQRMLSETVLRSKYRTDSLFPDESFQGTVDENGFDVTWIRKQGLRGADAIFNGTFMPGKKGTTVQIDVHMIFIAKLVVIGFCLEAFVATIWMLFDRSRFGNMGIFGAVFFLGVAYLFYWGAMKTYQYQIEKAAGVFERLFGSGV